jgi:hypothetical protein
MTEHQNDALRQVMQPVIERMEQWERIYPPDYIRRFFRIYDGELDALIKAARQPAPEPPRAAAQNERSEWILGYEKGLSERENVFQPGIQDMLAAAIYLARNREIPAAVTLNRWEAALRATPQPTVTVGAPAPSAYRRGVKDAVEILLLYKVPEGVRRDAKPMNEYLDHIAKDILAHSESSQAYAELGRTPADLDRPALRETLATVEKALKVVVSNYEARKVMAELEVALKPASDLDRQNQALRELIAKWRHPMESNLTKRLCADQLEAALQVNQ